MTVFLQHRRFYALGFILKSFVAGKNSVLRPSWVLSHVINVRDSRRILLLWRLVLVWVVEDSKLNLRYFWPVANTTVLMYHTGVK